MGIRLKKNRLKNSRSLSISEDKAGIRLKKSSKVSRGLSILVDKMGIRLKKSSKNLPVSLNLSRQAGHQAKKILPADTVDIADGTPVTLTMAVKKSFLTENGIETKDLVVLRNLFGSWYQTSISNIIDDGTYVTFTVNTWTCGSAFAIGFDTAGTKYKTESKNVILSGGKDTGLDIPTPVLIGIGAAIAVILIIVIVIVSVKKRGGRKNGGKKDSNDDIFEKLE